MTQAAKAWHWEAVHDLPSAELARPGAAVAWGNTAARLHERLAKLPPDEQSQLQLTANRDVLIVLGASENLPWVSGIEYARACPEAPALWLPMQWRPDIPADLLMRALFAAHERQPILLWPRPAAVVPLDKQLPLSPALLQRVAMYWEGR